ncbi:MAG: PLP-dependent aminotransferase family protein [Actinomycetota bacterium]|nr:PLP-dependent aminotransferase family protein [Actinomycetota bacterium]
MLSPGSVPATTNPVVGSSPVRDLLALTRRPEVISFAGGLPATELIDVDGLRAAFDAVLGGPEAAASLQYSTTEGDPRLRAELAALMTARGTATDDDDVLVTTGSQQGLGLITAALVKPGDPVLVEEPTYLAALQVLRLWGARPIGVPCDAEGLDVAALDSLAARHGARILYTIPTFQNPTGRSLSAARRDALAEVAQRHDLWVVEDDPYGELRYRGIPGRPLASLLGLQERTIALSTLSKICAPGLRIGWVRCPPTLHRALVVAKQAADLHTSTIDQAAAAHWLATVDLPKHLSHLRAAYARRHAALLGGLGAALPAGSEHSDPDGGMFVWVRLPPGWDAEACLPAALARDVAYVPGSAFFAGAPDPRTLRLSFSGEPPERIVTGLERLAAGFVAAQPLATDAYR